MNAVNIGGLVIPSKGGGRTHVEKDTVLRASRINSFNIQHLTDADVFHKCEIAASGTGGYF